MADIRYLEYDPNDLWAAMTAVYREAGGDVLFPGDEKEILLRGVQNILILAMNQVENALRMDTLTYAVGEYLDLYGEKRGCVRKPAEKAFAEALITGREMAAAYTIPAGTAMTADGQAVYLTKEAAVFPAEGGSLTVEIEAQEAGSAGNGLLSGTEMYLASPVAGVESVLCVKDAADGADTETDEKYRERIREYGLTSVTTGPAEQYEAKAREVSTLILDAAARNAGAGNVDVRLVLDPGADEDKIIAMVREALNDKTVRPLTDTVTVARAEELPYTLNIQYRVEGNISDDYMRTVAATYKAWQENSIGMAFNPDKLVAALYNAGAARVVIAAGSHFRGQTAVYTEIEKWQRAKGTINLTRIA